MKINRNNVIEIIEKSGLKPDKDYGQNYLLEPTICENIINLLDVQDEENVLEIGPGIGSLTHYLTLHKNAKIDLVDIDERMINFLKILYNQPNVNLIINDIRKHDVSTYEKIVGNLPYNITTETVVYLLEKSKNAKKMVLMCQTEAFNRFSDLSGKDYGPVSILLHLLGTSKRNFVVKPGSFYPAPKCSSLVFTIDFKEGVDRDLALKVYDFSKKLFLNRRKTIYNNLSSAINDKDKSLKILEKLSIPSNKRPEELSPETFVDIYKQSILN